MIFPGSITFEDGQIETEIEIILKRDLPQREATFKLQLIEPDDEDISTGLDVTLVTVIRDKGKLNFMLRAGFTY